MIQGLLAAIASAHAFFAGIAIAAICAGLHMNGVERAILLISTVERTAGDAAADIGVRLFLRHCLFLLEIVLLKFSILILSRFRPDMRRFMYLQFKINQSFT